MHTPQQPWIFGSVPTYIYTHILTSKGIPTNAQVRALNHPHLSGRPQSYVHNGNVEAVPHFSFFAHLVGPLALYILKYFLRDSLFLNHAASFRYQPVLLGRIDSVVFSIEWLMSKCWLCLCWPCVGKWHLTFWGLLCLSLQIKGDKP